MKKILFISLISIALIFNFSCKKQQKSDDSNNQQTSNQQTSNSEIEANYVNKLLKFAVNFPKTPQEETTSLDLLGSEVPFHTFMVDEGNIAFMVAVAEYPEDLIEQIDDKYDILTNAMQGFVTSQNLEIKSQQKTTLSGEPALRYDASGDYYVSILNVFYDNKLYQVGIAKQDNFPDKKTVDDFIGSFRILK